MQALHSLRKFEVSFSSEELESFPEKALLPPTLTHLTINFFRNLKSLNEFQHLTSLQHLDIAICDNLQCLPKEGLPASLSSLRPFGCHLLEKRCQREKGEDWTKIAHIPMIMIEDEVITWAMSREALFPSWGTFFCTNINYEFCLLY